MVQRNASDARSGFEAAELTCPPWLSRPAKRYFKHWAPLLGQRGSTTLLDGAGLAELAEIAAEVETLRKVIAKQGHTYEATTVTGGTLIRARPEAGLLADASRRLKVFLDSYGLTPQSRGKIDA